MHTHLPENVDILGHEKNMTINEEALSSCSGVREEEKAGGLEMTLVGTWPVPPKSLHNHNNADTLKIMVLQD